MSTWVQHRSGQGDKWKVETKNDHFWEVSDNNQDHWFLRLPLKEYVECSPTEEWEDVTEQTAIFVDDCHHIRFYCDGGDPLMCPKRYHLSKVQIGDKWAFIIEKRKS